MRVKRGYTARRRRKKFLRNARGYYQSRSRSYKTARETVERAWAFATAHRKLKKRDFRKLWITRINAAVRENGMSYSEFINKLNKADVKLNRKMLAYLAMEDPAAFSHVVKTVAK